MNEKADCARCAHPCRFADMHPYFCLWEQDAEAQEEYKRRQRLKHFDEVVAKAKEKKNGL